MPPQNDEMHIPADLFLYLLKFCKKVYVLRLLRALNKPDAYSLVFCHTGANGLMKEAADLSYLYLKRPKVARAVHPLHNRCFINHTTKEVLNCVGSRLWMMYKLASYVAWGRWLSSDEITCEDRPWSARHYVTINDT